MKKWLLICAFVAFSGHASARSLTEVYGHGQPEYHRMVYLRFFNRFLSGFSFDKHLSASDQAFIHECLEAVSAFADDSHPWQLNYLHFALTGLKDPEMRLAVGCPLPEAKRKEKILALLKSHHLLLPKDLPLESLFWIEWSSQTPDLDLYYYGPGGTLNRYRFQNKSWILLQTWRLLNEDEISHLQMPSYLKERAERMAALEKSPPAYLVSLKSLNTDSLAPEFKPIVKKSFDRFGLIPDQVLFQTEGPQWLFLL